jgi:hypothetical protein
MTINSSSTIQAEEKILKHLFLSENLPQPKEWYLQLYSDLLKPIQTFNNELDKYQPISKPVKVRNWNILEGQVTATTITRPSISNAGLILFPLVPANQTWSIKYIGLWAGNPTDLTSYLFSYRIYDQSLTLITGQQFYFSPGELILYYN